MAISHNGKQAPTLPEDMNPGDTDTFYVCWTDKLNGATISGSTWTIPANFTEEGAATNVSPTAGGTTFTDCNSIDLSTSETSGVYTITNNCTFSDARVIKRSFKITIDEGL